MSEASVVGRRVEVGLDWSGSVLSAVLFSQTYDSEFLVITLRGWVYLLNGIFFFWTVSILCFARSLQNLMGILPVPSGQATLCSSPSPVP